MQNKLWRTLRYFWLVLLIGLGIFTLQNNPVQFDLLGLLPDSKTKSMAQVKSFMDETNFSKQILILLGHEDQDIARKALQTLRDSISKNTLPLEENNIEKMQKQFKGFFNELSHYKHSLLSKEDRTLLKKDQGSTLKDRALLEFAMPLGTFGPADIHQDPFFLFSKYIISLQPEKTTEIDPETGDAFIKKDGKFWYLYHAQITQPVFSLTIQEQLTKTLGPLLEVLPVDTLKTGAIFYAARGTQQAQSEISLVGGISALLIILFLLVIFRSFAPLGFSLLIILSGLAGGISLSFLFYGSLHILALVFGGSLIGVCVDYALHYYCAHLHIEKSTRFSVLKSLLPALPLGVLSSCIGYGLLTLVPFPGIQQMAFLAASGLLSAFITVVLWGPVLLKNTPQNNLATPKKIQEYLEGLSKISLNKKILAPLVVLLSIAGFYSLSFDDNVQNFQTLDQNLKTQENLIKEKINTNYTPTFFAISAETLESLLQKEEEITDQLDALNIPYQSLSKIIPSQKRQLENQKLIQEKLTIPHLGSLLNTLGLPAKNTEEAPENLLKNVPMLPDLWSPLFKVSSTGFDGRVLIQNSQNKEALLNIAAQIDEAIYLDPPQEYSQVFKEYRGLMIKVIAGVFCVILLLLSLLKGVGPALKITTPVLISIVLTTSIISLLQISLTLFHVMGLLLVLCIGIDYALFLYWRKTPENKGDFFLLANAMAALTTLFSFGMLSLSDTAAVQGFGLSVFIGISLNFLLTTLYLGQK